MKKRVLLVDDHPKILKFLEIDLTLRGFEVFSASSGRQALEMVKTARPDIMLLDMVMPEMDGFEVLSKLRVFSQVPVIAFSASPEKQDSAIRLGADDFVPKPLDMTSLVTRINLLIRETGN